MGAKASISRRNRGDGESGQPAGAAAVEVEHGAADGNAAGIAAECAREHVGEAGDVQFPLEIGFAMTATSMPVVLNRVLDAVTKTTAIKIAREIRQEVPGIAADLASALHGSMKLTCGGG